MGLQVLAEQDREGGRVGVGVDAGGEAAVWRAEVGDEGFDGVVLGAFGVELRVVQIHLGRGGALVEPQGLGAGAGVFQFPHGAGGVGAAVRAGDVGRQGGAEAAPQDDDGEVAVAGQALVAVDGELGCFGGIQGNGGGGVVPGNEVEADAGAQQRGEGQVFENAADGLPLVGDVAGGAEEEAEAARRAGGVGHDGGWTGG